MGDKFQRQTPEEGQLTLGPVIHILTFDKLVREGILTHDDVKGWVVDDGEDED